MADEDGTVDGGSIDDGGDGHDPFDGVTFDETWVQAARRSEDDAETRAAKLQRIDADYRRLGSERQTLAANADKTTRRARNRTRLAIGLVVVVLAGLGTFAFLQRRGNDRTVAAPDPSTTTTSASTTTSLDSGVPVEGGFPAAAMSTMPATPGAINLANGRDANGEFVIARCWDGYAPTSTGFEIEAVPCGGPFTALSAGRAGEAADYASNSAHLRDQCFKEVFDHLKMRGAYLALPSDHTQTRWVTTLNRSGLTFEGYAAPPSPTDAGAHLCALVFLDRHRANLAEFEAAIRTFRVATGQTD